MPAHTDVSSHYTHGGLTEAIRVGIASLGKAPDTVTVDDLAPEADPPLHDRTRKVLQTRVIVVNSIPRNAIGKALRREMPQQLASQLAKESRRPSTPMEQALLAIWHKVLRRDDIGVTDNVFQFGADPLRAEMASGLIDEAISVRISTKVLYAKPTVCEQAAYCAAQREHR